jgi:hypothetical protein
VAVELLYSLTVEIEVARQQWYDGRRRVDDSRRVDRRRYDRLVAQVEVVLAALRGRVGQIFTLAELADAYGDADVWVHELLDEYDPDGEPVTEAGTVADAAFDHYARGASDYSP